MGDRRVNNDQVSRSGTVRLVSEVTGVEVLNERSDINDCACQFNNFYY